MFKIKSILTALNVYMCFKSGKSVTLAPGDNHVTGEQLSLLQSIPAFAQHVARGFLVAEEAEAAAKAAEEAEAAAKAAEEAEAAAKAAEEAEAAAQLAQAAALAAPKTGAKK